MFRKSVPILYQKDLSKNGDQIKQQKKSMDSLVECNVAMTFVASAFIQSSCCLIHSWSLPVNGTNSCATTGSWEKYSMSISRCHCVPLRGLGLSPLELGGSHRLSLRLSADPSGFLWVKWELESHGDLGCKTRKARKTVDKPEERQREQAAKDVEVYY